MKFNFISLCMYFRGVCPMYCYFSNYLVPMSLGTILFVNVAIRIFGDTLEDRPNQGRWCHHVLIWRKLGLSMSYYLLFHSNAISVTSIYLMHTFLASTLCRLLHGMTCFIRLVSIVVVLAICLNCIIYALLWYLLFVSNHPIHLVLPCH